MTTIPFRLRVTNSKDKFATGNIISGTIAKGDKVRILPQGLVANIVGVANTPTDTTITFDRQLDLETASIVCSSDSPVESADQFEVEIDWNDGAPMLSGRSYQFSAGLTQFSGSITNIKYRLGKADQRHLSATTLEQGQTGIATISLSQVIAFTSFRQDPGMGMLEIKDKDTGGTLGTCKIIFALRRASNIHRQAIDIDRTSHAAQKGQKPCVLWFTGLSGSGKSSIANELEKALHQRGRHTFLLDGDNIRHGLNRDLGFTDADRVENIRRIAEVAKLMADAGLIVITSFISPFISERQMARKRLPEGEFIEIFIDTPLQVCEERDEKGLYAKARAGLVKNFTGIDSAYEKPVSPEIVIETTKLSQSQAADKIIEFLKENKHLS
jgi:bifunctional enzyme CysN/CysC